MYQVLYRKWRPKVFSDVVGQEHITKTLMNAVDTGRVSHAYLFTGSRGTGKTTCAKILAKAVNCEHPVNGNPCNECASCKGIDDGSIVDVVEIDAASNNGVDNIRDIRDETNYMPSSVKYRVFIIDEVHMLSPGAFNALLKTLEEPPAHVKFILATTEVHKLLPTILSRCQRFDFKRISPEDIAGRIKYVASQENIDLTDDGAMLISRIADGGMRDALSLLDKCTSFQTTIDEALVSQAAGIAGKEHVYALTDAIRDHDCEKALVILNELYQNSCDVERLFSELISHFRNMMIAYSVPNYKKLILSSENEAEKIKSQAQTLTLETIISSMEIINNAISDLRKGANKKIIAEMAVIRLTSPRLDSDNSALLRRIAELERTVKNGVYVPGSDTVSTANTVSAKKTELPKKVTVTEKVDAPVFEETQEQTPPQNQHSPVEAVNKSNENESADSADINVVQFMQWSEAIELIQQNDPTISGFLANSTAEINDEIIIIHGANPFIKNFITKQEHYEAIQKAVFDTCGKKLKITLSGQKKPEQASKKEIINKPVKNENVTSPLDVLLNRARELDIPIVEQ